MHFIAVPWCPATLISNDSKGPMSFARATFLLACLRLVLPCGAQESSSWLGSRPFILPVDKGCLQGASPAPGEGNGNPLQCSCLGNPMDGGAWWAAVYGVARTDLAAAAPAPFIMPPSTGILLVGCALPSLNVTVFPVYFFSQVSLLGLGRPCSSSPWRKPEVRLFLKVCFECWLPCQAFSDDAIGGILPFVCFLGTWPTLVISGGGPWEQHGLPCVTSSPSAAVSQHTPVLSTTFTSTGWMICSKSFWKILNPGIHVSPILTWGPWHACPCPWHAVHAWTAFCVNR